MPSLREYLAESEHRATNPVAGDDFVFEFDDGTEVATYIIETSEDEILVAANATTYAVMEQWCGLSDILLEDEDFSQCEAVFEIAPALAMLGGRLAGGALASELGLGATGTALARTAGGAVASNLFSDDEEEVDEAEYQGRKVPLGKPMRGDVAKFKVYVKDPKTGNIKKVNFGHGGSRAKKAGQKTMRIRKSNPKARKSFRARHNCANPGPRTGARYWSCRAW